MSAARVVFMGSDRIALPVLDFLWSRNGNDLEFCGVFSQPDRPSGRGKRKQPNPVVAWARERPLRLHQPEELEEGAWRHFQQLNPRLVVVMAYGHFIPRSWVSFPPLGMWNLHVSLLPKYRGASPVVGALVSGDRETGVTLMEITSRMDAGAMAGQIEVPVHENDSEATLAERLAQASPSLLEEQLPALLAGRMDVLPQDENKASYTRRLSKLDGCLDFSFPASVLARRIRALQPWPGTRLRLSDPDVCLACSVARALPSAEDGHHRPGEVISTGPDGIQIRCGNGDLLVENLQRSGGRMLPAAEFLRGFPDWPEKPVFVSEEMPDLVSPRPFSAKPRQ